MSNKGWKVTIRDDIGDIRCTFVAHDVADIVSIGRIRRSFVSAETKDGRITGWTTRTKEQK